MQALKYVALPFIMLILMSTTLLASDRELTAMEIRLRIVGNTVVGTENGQYYEEYLEPSGRIAGRSKSEAYRGWWRLNGNKLCFAYEADEDSNGRPASNWDCSAVALSGDRLTWKDDGDQARLVAGRALSSMRTSAKSGIRALKKQN